MLRLMLKFEIDLEENSVSVLRHYGPQFHRWLPDGEKDAIILKTRDSSADLKVWFERSGYVDRGFIKYDSKRREVDPEIVPKQAVLDAGSLKGLLEIQGFSEEELVPLRENKVGHARYIALGKKVVKLICPPVSQFLSIIRTNYGQYWVPEFEAWDSRKRSIGGYCHSILRLQWSLDEGKTWSRFIPDLPVGTVGVQIYLDRSYSEFISQSDWREIALAIRKGYRPSGAALILARAHQLLDEGNLKHAFIEGVSALELALSEFARRDLRDDAHLSKEMKAFWNLPLSSQLVSIAIGRGKIPTEQVKDALKAIELRNKVIHEGWDPPDNTKTKLSALLEIVAGLLSGPKLRFPESNPGNAMRPIKVWEKQERQRSKIKRMR